LRRLVTRAVDRHFIRKTNDWLAEANAAVHPSSPDQLRPTRPDPRYFDPPGGLPVTVEKPILHQAWRTFRFPTPLPTSFAGNNTCTGRIYNSPHPAGITTLIIHGWAAHSFHIYENHFARPLLRNGIDCVLPVLPFHMERCPKGSADGEYMVSSNLKLSLDTLRQAVVEARYLVHWLKAASNLPVGILGISLGGLVAGLVAATEPELRFAVLMIPAADPARILWDSPLCAPIRDKLQGSGISRSQVSDFCRIAAPGEYSPVVPVDDIFFIVASNDCCIYPDWIREWSGKWSCPNNRYYNHGHISSLFGHRVKRDIIRFILQRNGSSRQ